MTIRQSTPADIHKLSKLWFSLCTEHSPSSHPHTSAWREIQLNNFRNPNHVTLVADEGGSLIGFVSFTIEYEPMASKICASGGHLYVKPEHRGKKIGDSLYYAAVNEARKRHAQLVSVICFDDAKDLWLHYGYKPVHTIMEKEL